MGPASVVAEGVGFSPPPLHAPLHGARSLRRRGPNSVRIPLSRSERRKRTPVGARFRRGGTCAMAFEPLLGDAATA